MPSYAKGRCQGGGGKWLESKGRWRTSSGQSGTSTSPRERRPVDKNRVSRQSAQLRQRNPVPVRRQKSLTPFPCPCLLKRGDHPSYGCSLFLVPATNSAPAPIPFTAPAPKTTYSNGNAAKFIPATATPASLCHDRAAISPPGDGCQPPA
ncbi:hypothetical protein K0M31_013018 [Melipona bicolor]|uniref:Uncharacterized protein n=1 Tax=Melipona bicolor TaxID=60889 RepID=A0AA40FIR0_9HYME|nr:hypothetical protein K0M31_013018 [Melipona bicolor]